MQRITEPAEPVADGRLAEEQHAGSRLGWAEVGLIFAFWTFMAVLEAVGRLQDPSGIGLTGQVAFRTVLRIFSINYLWALLTPLIFWLSSRFSMERANWPRRLGLHLGAAVLIAITVDLFHDLLRAELLPTPRGRNVGFDPVGAITRLWFLNDLMIYFAILAAGFARDYFLRYKARLEEATQLRTQAARLEAELVEARLQALRMQLNPHFLFNTLHAVSTLVARDPRGVRRMIARLSDLLRYTLEGSTEQEVPLSRELQFLRGYLEIQQIRFQGRLETELDVDPEVLDACVPNLILQPLVENAVKHGVSKIEGVGRIEVRIWREGRNLYLQVSDNGPGFSGDGSLGLEQGVGLRNTRARLEGLYGSVYDLRFTPSEEGGLAAQITIPFHTGADLHTSVVQMDEDGIRNS